MQKKLKNKKNILVVFVLLLIFPFSYQNLLMCQVTYSSEKLFQIGTQLPEQCLTSKDAYVNCPEIIKEKSIIIKYNDLHKISHLGIDLFNEDIKNHIEYPVCEFMERYFLELILLSDNKKIIQKLKENNVIIQRNGLNFGTSNFNSIISFLEKIKPETNLAIKKAPLRYTVLWETTKKELFSLSFPAERELISGKNRKEADEELNYFLNHNNCSGFAMDTVFLDSAPEFISGKNIYEKRKRYYNNKSINNNAYYLKYADGTFYLINDKKYPEESISNQFLGYVENENLILNVTHKGYGSALPEIAVSLNDFICLLKKECKMYCSVQEKNKGILNITLILHNENCNYIHMLSAKMNKEDIFKANGIIKGEFYSYVPQHNSKTN